MRRTNSVSLAIVGSGLALSALILVGLMFFAGFWRPSSSYAVSAYVANARGISADSTVFEGGLPAGLVTGVKRNGPGAILTLRIDHGVRPLPVDSTIQLGLRSLAGEADVLLMPGNSRQLVRNGSSLGLSQDQDYTEVDQILNEFAGPTEGRTREFFQGVGAGVHGEGQNLNQTLGGFASVVNNSPPLTSTIAAQHTQVADIVQNFGNIMGAIGQRTQALQDFAHGALTTFNEVARRDSAFKSLLAVLPSLFGSNGDAFGALDQASPRITPVIGELADVVAKLKPAIGLLTPASSKGIDLLDALGNASPALKNLLVQLIKLKPSAAATLPAVHALGCQLDPMLRYIAPYGPDISAFFENFGGVVDAYGNGAHQMLGSLVVDPSEVFRGIESQPVSSALTTLLNSGILSRAGAHTGYHFMLPPGQIHNTTLGVGDHGPVQWGATHVYPHVTADCSK